MSDKTKTENLFTALIKKASLKQDVYKNTIEALSTLKEGMEDLVVQYNRLDSLEAKKIPVVFRDRSEFEAELKFAGDTLVFMMHSNIFEMPRDHEVMKTPYVKEDVSRSYCGIINIFNFLSDSFKYNRINDVGYLIGRIFINKDMHYFIEGKREIGFLYESFANAKMTKKSASEII